MTGGHLSIGRLQRMLWTGGTEVLSFKPGVNLLIGPPNTGKTKWLQMLDYLLGEVVSFDSEFEDDIVRKYTAASVELFVDGERFLVERRWNEPGSKSKIFVNELEFTPRAFQHFLLEKLRIPLLHFPKGNPMSGQTWPELSFRMLLRHIYRQQRFWGNLADQQPEGEQHACLLQFLGLAEHIFTEAYGELIALRLEVETLKARRDQYGLTLTELSRDVLSGLEPASGVTFNNVRQAEDRIVGELGKLRNLRDSIIAEGTNIAVPEAFRGRVEMLSEQRAALIVGREEVNRKAKATAERRDDMRRYRNELHEESNRLVRTEDAGAILADLKITHCPACDQTVLPASSTDKHCHLCHQSLPDEPLIEELGATRLKFELNRLSGELKEADSLLSILEREVRRLTERQTVAEEKLRMVENELAPARKAVSALVQEEISAIDMAMGELNERQRQVARLKGALELGRKLGSQIAELENRIEPLQDQVRETMRSADFGRAEEFFSNGMNEYLNAIHRLRPQSWRHSEVSTNLSRSVWNMKVGSKRWNTALGGTDTLYFLMAYHYSLLCLSNKETCHYPGLSVIDLPGDFLGESVEDKENFIVQPFIDLLSQPEFSNAQVIITGASFQGLDGAHREVLREVFVE